MVPTANKVGLRIFQSGYCTAPAHIINPVDGKGRWRFYATWALLEHPSQGLILFDTGYAPRFRTVTQRLPFKMYGVMTPMSLEPHEPVIEQLRALGYQASDIKAIILSHFHADHIAGLLDFPWVKIICNAAGLQQALHLKSWKAVSAGLIPDLLPPDLAQRAESIPDAELGQLNAPISTFYDLFGDGSIRLVALPGHGRGQMGALLQTETGEVLLAADAAWNKNAFERNILPRPLVKLFFDDWSAYQKTFAELRQFAERHPEVKICFTHSPEVAKEALRNEQQVRAQSDAKHV
jgi:glyoxylase-like metal-dependent hydrolase (beta-lactamase superfamily II)